MASPCKRPPPFLAFEFQAPRAHKGMSAGRVLSPRSCNYLWALTWENSVQVWLVSIILSHTQHSLFERPSVQMYQEPLRKCTYSFPRAYNDHRLLSASPRTSLSQSRIHHVLPGPPGRRLHVFHCQGGDWAWRHHHRFTRGLLDGSQTLQNYV